MRFGGIVLVTLLTLGACSSQPAPVEPARTSTTPTPTATPPAMPDQAEKDSPEGAAAFVKHYVDVFNYAAATGDVDELTRLSSPDCEGCQSYIDLYRETYAAGGYFKGADWTIGDIDLEQSGSKTYATTVVKTDPGPYRESSAGREKTSSGQDNRISFALSRSESTWTLTQMGLGAVE